MKKYHYVYEIVYTDNKRYIGARTSSVPPEEDTSYIGSSKYTPNNNILQKSILGVFPRRDEALAFEIYLHDKFNVHISDMYYNKAKQTSTGFSTAGITKDSCEWLQRRKYLSGDQRTATQKAGAKKGAIAATGQKVPSRGRSGIKANKFKPWYYITPDGKYVEFTSTPISTFCETAHGTPLSRAVIFNCTSKYNHTKVPHGAAKGWTVGFLPKPMSNILCYPYQPSSKAWWYESIAGTKTYVYGMTRSTFCDLGVVKGLKYDVIKHGIKTGKPLNKYKFKGWSFGLVTGTA